MLLSILLNKSQGKFEESALKNLPLELSAEAMKYTDLQADDPLPLLNQKNDFLNFCHYSWLQETFEKLEPLERTLCLSALPEDKKSKLSTILKEGAQPLPTPFGKRFLLQRFLKRLPDTPLIPLAYLKESPAKRLLALKKEQLVTLIDFLGLYDLAHEVRKTVATKQLKSIYKSLSPSSQQFLRNILHQKDRLTPSPMHLETWEGEAKDLFRHLHRAGLKRLAIALSGQDPNLIGYFVHKLDKGRGAILQKWILPSEVPTQTGAAWQQIESIKPYLSSEEKPL